MRWKIRSYARLSSQEKASHRERQGVIWKDNDKKDAHKCNGLVDPVDNGLDSLDTTFRKERSDAKAMIQRALESDRLVKRPAVSSETSLDKSKASLILFEFLGRSVGASLATMDVRKAIRFANLQVVAVLIVLAWPCNGHFIPV